MGSGRWKFGMTDGPAGSAVAGRRCCVIGLCDCVDVLECGERTFALVQLLDCCHFKPSLAGESLFDGVLHIT